MVSQTFKTITRWMVSMAIGGVTLGLIGFLTSEWAVRFVDDNTGAVEEYAPVILTIGILLIAPAVAAGIGLRHGRRASGRTAVIEAAVGSLTGSVLFVILGLSLLGQYSAFVGDAPAIADIATIAGLVALTSVVAGTGAVLTTLTRSEPQTDDASSTVPSEPGPDYTT